MDYKYHKMRQQAMGYTIQKLDNLPVVVMSLDENFRTKEEMAACAADLLQFFDQSPVPVYQIVDIRELTLDFDSMLALVQMGIKGDTRAVKHPNNLETIVVTNSRFYQMAAKGLNTATFGHVNLLIYESLEAALNDVRQKIAPKNNPAEN